LAIVTHDLRTPLSAIMAGASLLRSADPALLDAERVRQRADAIQRSAQHMSRLVQDLADLAQIDAGHLSIARTPQDPASLVREVVVDLQPTAAQRDSVLRCATLAELPMVSIDRDRVRQVFTNLIGNASKAGASTIEVGARPREADVMFWVSDDGPGISSEELPRMFERYWRSRSAGYQGTGLGLPIASGIVQAHGGRMWVESTLGAGSTFFFAIPRDEPH
jgi:signal transduction histidine kinase